MKNRVIGVWILGILLSFGALAVDKDSFSGISQSKSEPSPAATAESPQPYVAAVDTYGSSRLNEATLKSFLGPELDEWLQAGMKLDPVASKMEDKLAEKVKKKYDFVSAEWSVVQFYQPDEKGFPIYVTLDVMEKSDVKRRVNFLSAPTGEYKDPDGLLASWTDYEREGLRLVTVGELVPEVDPCPAYHCPFGHKNPKLKPYEKIFVDGVKKNAKALVEIQEKDKNPSSRAAATFLLAYWKANGPEVVKQMVGRIRDPDMVVRNNALRVLGNIAEFNTELTIPHRPLVEALRFPRVSDRSKAAFALYLMAQNSAAVREDLMKEAVPDLLLMLASHQPDHRELTYGILRKISGKDYAATDLASWQKWWNKMGKDRGVAAGKSP